MATFAKFIMLDSGREIHINPLFVEQVRDGPEPDTTAVYFSGRSQSISLQAKVATVMKAIAHPIAVVAPAKDSAPAKPASSPQGTVVAMTPKAMTAKAKTARR